MCTIVIHIHVIFTNRLYFVLESKRFEILEQRKVKDIYWGQYYSRDVESLFYRQI